jgi:hypothetical protein
VGGGSVVRRVEVIAVSNSRYAVAQVRLLQGRHWGAVVKRLGYFGTGSGAYKFSQLDGVGGGTNIVVTFATNFPIHFFFSFFNIIFKRKMSSYSKEISSYPLNIE